MRRRLLLGEGVKEYVFSASTTSRTVDSASTSTSITIISTANGTNTPYTVVSYDGLVTAVTTAATSVTIRYNANSTTLQRTGTVTLKQNGSNNILTITVTQRSKAIFASHTAIVLDAANGSSGYTHLSISQSNYTITHKPDWVDVSYSVERIDPYTSRGCPKVTATSLNNSTTSRKDYIELEFDSSHISIAIIQMPNSYKSVDGHQYITFGGLKWAIKNVGASSPSDDGDYYMYGKGARTYQETSGETKYSGMESPLASSADTATQVMGGGWRMPTYAEISGFSEYNTDYASYNGNSGFARFSKYVGIGTGTCLFFPSGGWFSNGTIDYPSRCYCLTSTPYNSTYCYSIYGDYDDHFLNQQGTLRFYSTNSYRTYGLLVRGVHT